uniref:Uncharacterized protein n=1 Tax=Cacopsylla melanoneura TaxID=428564 RepID=A0A8D9F0B9_9HEMI
MAYSLRYLKECRNTFTFNGQTLCDKCEQYRPFYNCFKTLVECSIDGSEVALFEMSFPFENNQEHQAQEEESFYRIQKYFSNCLFSADIKFWIERSKRTGNTLYSYRRECCKHELKLKMKESLGVETALNNPMSYTEFCHIKRNIDSYAFVHTYDNLEEDTSKTLKSIDKNYVASRIFKAIYTISTFG